MPIAQNVVPYTLWSSPGLETTDRPAVKSASRALQVLEYFDLMRSPATAAEVAAFYGYPQSSTSHLLRTLAAGGYLEYDRETRRYTISMRVSLLGSWCDSRFVLQGQLLQTMTRLNEQTGRAVFLASQVGSFAHYIYVCQSTIPGRPRVALGTRRPLSFSAAGIALLSLMDDAQATRIILRNNADRGGGPAVSVRAVLAMVEQVRRDGYIYFEDPILNGAILAAPLVGRLGQPGMSICLGDFIEPMAPERERITAIFCDLIVGAVSSPDQAPAAS